MSTPPVIRDARLTDLPALLRLEAQFPGDRLSRRQLRHHLRQPSSRLRVLETADGVRGYWLVVHRAGSRAARLYSLLVDTVERGSGFGALLLADAEAEAGRVGMRALRLEVRADNAAALALYRRAGYRPIGIRPGYYQDGVDALRLERDLRAATVTDGTGASRPRG